MYLKDLPAHHAVLIVHHNRKEIGSLLWEELGTTPSMHKFVDQAVFDIDTARELIVWANTPYHEPRFAIVSFHTATLPAQNAMLKVLEEPSEGVRFVLVTSNKEHLLETVISRMRFFVPDKKETISSLAHEFLETNPSSRMKLKGIVELLGQEDEEGRKDREAIRAFILGLINALSRNTKIPKKYIKEAFVMASYVGDPSTSGKTIVEYLSFLLPKCDIIA